MPAWLLILLQQFILPEVQSYFEKYFAENGKLPTKEELEASILNDSNAAIIRGLTWLETHGG